MCSCSDEQQEAANPNRRGLQVQHIGADLTIKREEIKAGVFRPSWRQPTMTLEEFADKEVADALERQERNKYVAQLGSICTVY